MGNFLAGIKGRLLAWAIVAAVLIPCFMCGISQANKPETFPGDTIAWRTCKDCSGQGCATCDDRGELWVIAPGPNHPVWVPVRVHEANVPQPPIPAVESTEERLKPIPGAIGGARVELSRDGQTVSETSTFTGRTRVRLAPGTWAYTVSRDGYRAASGKLEVPALKGEIWKTRTADDTLATPLVVPLSR